MTDKSDAEWAEQRLRERDRSDIQVDEETLFEVIRINNGDPNDTWQNLKHWHDGPWRIRRLSGNLMGDLGSPGHLVVTNGNEVIPWHQVVSLKRLDDRHLEPTTKK